MKTADMKLYHVKGRRAREIEHDVVDYGNGNILVMYKNSREVSVVPTEDIVVEEGP